MYVTERHQINIISFLIFLKIDDENLYAKHVVLSIGSVSLHLTCGVIKFYTTTNKKMLSE